MSAVQPPRPTRRPAGPWDTAPVVRPPSPRVAQNRAFLWGALAGIFLALGVYGGIVAWSDSVDPWHGVPWCTDALADAHQVCHGDPAANPATPDQD